MKKINLFQALIVILIFSACGSGTNQTGESQSDSARAGISDVVVVKNDCIAACDSDSSHLIDIDSAAVYLWDYYTRFKELSKTKGAFTEISSENYLSAEMTDLTEKFRSDSDSTKAHCGLLLYFYQDNDQFRMAWKRTSKLISPSVMFPIPDPQDENLYGLTQCPVNYPPADFSSKADLLSFIVGYSASCEAEAASAGENAINENANRFIDNFGRRSDSRNPAIDPVAFFHSKEVNQVLRQDGCVGLRFFWGYSLSDQKLKVIVIGIDRNGVIIAGDNSKVLERSWPPW